MFHLTPAEARRVREAREARDAQIFQTYARSYGECLELRNDGQFDECLEAIESRLHDDLYLPRYFRIKLILLKATCTEDWYDATDLVGLAQSQWFVAQAAYHNIPHSDLVKETLSGLQRAINQVSNALSIEAKKYGTRAKRDRQEAEDSDEGIIDDERIIDDEVNIWSERFKDTEVEVFDDLTKNQDVGLIVDDNQDEEEGVTNDGPAEEEDEKKDDPGEASAKPAKRAKVASTSQTARKLSTLGNMLNVFKKKPAKPSDPPVSPETDTNTSATDTAALPSKPHRTPPGNTASPFPNDPFVLARDLDITAIVQRPEGMFRNRVPQVDNEVDRDHRFFDYLVVNGHGIGFPTKDQKFKTDTNVITGSWDADGTICSLDQAGQVTEVLRRES